MSRLHYLYRRKSSSVRLPVFTHQFHIVISVPCISQCQYSLLALMTRTGLAGYLKAVEKKSVLLVKDHKEFL